MAILAKANGKAEPTVAELMAEIARLKAAAGAAIKLKIAEKTGALSVYHGSRWPTTLYASQWEALLEAKEDILEFIQANADKLSRK
jgi:hypothetical protein